MPLSETEYYNYEFVWNKDRVLKCVWKLGWENKPCLELGRELNCACLERIRGRKSLSNACTSFMG